MSDRKDSCSMSILIFKSGTRFWLKFGASQRHGIFLEMKNKVSKISSRVLWHIFFLSEVLTFPPTLALFALHCEMMVKLTDNVRSGMDVCHSEG